ncbi:MAG TPA: acetyl-CoA carboxylase biotin carboxyl carrier protein subunit, partial [Bacteroides graminisolvens]|nr:acetyl-CoA carboxylase biotin carboxyl carrier protein subunit [Bacteroides graminisolvens]
MEIHIGNRIADIQLISKDGNNVVLSIDGKEFEIDVVMAENGSCSILHDGKSFNAQLIRQEDG